MAKAWREIDLLFVEQQLYGSESTKRTDLLLRLKEMAMRVSDRSGHTVQDVGVI